MPSLNNIEPCAGNLAGAPGIPRAAHAAPEGSGRAVPGDLTCDALSESAGATPFFSIVMPCYCMENHLRHAIECVLSQTCADWELIVVDDCSTDASASIAREYALRDSRIRLVQHERNKGLSAARNTGVAAARGLYLWMPDPDDFYEPNLLESVRSAVVASGEFDVVMFGHAEDYYDSDETFMYAREFPLASGVYENPREWRSFVIDFERETRYGYVWNKVYRMARIRELGLCFENVRLIEDIVFNVAFFQDMRSLCVVGGILYHYAKRQGKSLTNANAYSSEEYYALHRQRVALVRDQLVSWGVFDGRARGVLGGLYGRYVLSTLERQCASSEGLGHAVRRTRCKSMFADELYGSLIDAAGAESATLRLCLALLKTRNAGICLCLGRLLHSARAGAYGAFTRARSKR